MRWTQVEVQRRWAKARLDAWARSGECCLGSWLGPSGGKSLSIAGRDFVRVFSCLWCCACCGIVCVCGGSDRSGACAGDRHRSPGRADFTACG